MNSPIDPTKLSPIAAIAAAAGAPQGATTPQGAAPRPPSAPAPAPALTTLGAPQASVNPSPAKRALPVPNILIVGESGSGKTRSLKSLPWESGQIAFIDTERKGFDWINRIPADCYFPVSTPDDLFRIMTQVEINSKFSIAVVDSFTGVSIMTHEGMKNQFKGYDIYSQYTSRMVRFLASATSAKKRWIVTAIPELLMPGESSGNTTGAVIKRAAVVGREMEGKIEAQFAYAVFTKVTPQQNAKPKYSFVLYSDGVAQAKIPEGVTDDLTMDNDVNELLKLAIKAEQQY